MFLHTVLHLLKPDLLGEMAILGLGQRKYKMSLKAQKVKKCSRNDRDMAKGHRNQLEGLPWPNWGYYSMKINNDKIDC